MVHRFDGTMISMISWRTHELIVENVNGRACLETTPQQMIMHHDSDHFSHYRDVVTFPGFVDCIYLDAPNELYLENGLGNKILIRNTKYVIILK